MTEISQEPNYQGPGIYRHYKGGEYEVLGLGAYEEYKDEHGELMLNVVYRPRSSGSLLEQSEAEFWVRGLAVFNEWVHVNPTDEEMIRRFEKIGELDG